MNEDMIRIVVGLVGLILVLVWDHWDTRKKTEALLRDCCREDEDLLQAVECGLHKKKVSGIFYRIRKKKTKVVLRRYNVT